MAPRAVRRPPALPAPARPAGTRATRAFFDARGCAWRWRRPTPCPRRARRCICAPTARRPSSARMAARTPLWLHTSPEFAMKTPAGGGRRPGVPARPRLAQRGGERHPRAPNSPCWNGIAPASRLARADGRDGGAAARRPAPRGRPARGVRTTALATFERVTVADAFARWVGADVLGTAGDAPALAAQTGEGEAAPWRGRGRICSSACYWTGWSRNSAASARPSSPTGRPSRRRLPAAATRQTLAWPPCGSNCSSAA